MEIDMRSEEEKENTRQEVRQKNANTLNEAMIKLQKDHEALIEKYHILTTTTQNLLTKVSNLENQMNIMRAKLAGHGPTT